MKIVFMGTPEFAIPSLKKIFHSHHQLLAVVTGPDKPMGRGLSLHPTPIKRIARTLNLPVLTPERLKDESFIENLKGFHADIFVVVAFRILPSTVFTIPPKGTVNLHGSLLPKYRGAAPINWAIINGEPETGVTTFYIEEKVDTGDMILQKKMTIGQNETAGELHDRMCHIGADILLQTLDFIEQGKEPRQKQIGESSLAPKITKETCRIDWSKDAVTIYNLVRGLAPFPRAFTNYLHEELKICCVDIVENMQCPEATPGEIIAVDQHGKIFVATGKGIISIIELQPECKRRMTAGEYLRGHSIKVRTVLG